MSEEPTADERREAAEKLRERVEAKLLARDVCDVVADSGGLDDSTPAAELEICTCGRGRGSIVHNTSAEYGHGFSPRAIAPQPLESLDAFRSAARALKAAETAFHAAQQAYADAVRKLSEEAVK